jgi:hypothetical protein
VRSERSRWHSFAATQSGPRQFGETVVPWGGVRVSGLLAAQSQRDLRPCRRPLSGAPLTDRILSRANRSVGPRRNRPPGQIGNNAARLSCGDMPPGKRCRLGPLNPHSKVMEFSNQLGHLINALKQSLNTTKAAHIATHTNRQKFGTCEHMHYGTEFSNAVGIRFDKRRTASRCAKEQGLRPTRPNGTRARSTYRLLADHVSSIWRVAMGSAPFCVH